MTTIQLYLFHFSQKSITDCPCECCSKKAETIEHIDGRAPKILRDSINNLVALCSKCKARYSGGFKDNLINIHQKNLINLATKKKFA